MSPDRNSEPRSLPPSRSAALGGVGVIFVTGAFAIVAAAAVLVLARSYGFRMEAIDWVLLGLVLALTIGGGIALIRFIRNNPGAIGEARFDTTNKREDR
jgi:TRAP-type C4-dicarboxylate transport system permease small subunit